MLKEIIISFQAYNSAHRFVIKHRLWKWILLPGIAYCTLFMLGLYFFWTSCNDATEWIINNSFLIKWIRHLEENWMSLFFIIGQIILRLLLLIFYFSLVKFLFLIIGSPVFAYLSEKTNSIIEGKEIEFNFSTFANNILRSVFIAVKNLGWQSLFVLFLILFSVVPLIGWVSPIVLLIIDCYYLGFSMLDHSNERVNYSISESQDLIGHHRGLSFGNGIVFYVFHLIPVIGWVFAPSYALIAATISIHRAKKEEIIQ
jgi:CysZ protein